MHTDLAGNRIVVADKGRRRRMRLLLFILSAFLLWAVLTFFSQQDNLQGKNSRLAQMQKKLAESVKQNKELKLEVTRLNDPEYIEQRARKDFHMIRPGETLFVTPKSE
ncbi:MAG TPA: septum formation initiator family protein [Bacilli bacterium]